jgi:hypothetical protein
MQEEDIEEEQMLGDEHDYYDTTFFLLQASAYCYTASALTVFSALEFDRVASAAPRGTAFLTHNQLQYMNTT